MEMQLALLSLYHFIVLAKLKLIRYPASVGGFHSQLDTSIMGSPACRAILVSHRHSCTFCSG
ncbi:unnamed protein product, partial [Amoebophrya sp. A120]|eukprot:GSA120T00012294001.1